MAHDNHRHTTRDKVLTAASKLANVLFGDPERTPTSNLLTKWLSKATDVSVTTVVAVAAVFLLGWCVPATYSFKRKYLHFVARSKLVSKIESKLPAVFVLLLYIWIREYRKSNALVAHLKQLRIVPAVSDVTSAAGASNDHHLHVSRTRNSVDAASQRLLESVKRKYRSGFGLWCVVYHACWPVSSVAHSETKFYRVQLVDVCEPCVLHGERQPANVD